MPNPTYIEIMKRSHPELADMIDDIIKALPELQDADVKKFPGRILKAMVREKLPKIPFRGANEGTVSVKGARTEKTFSTAIMNPRWECDKAVADGDTRGRDEFIAEEAQDILDGSHLTVVEELYYGTGEGASMLGLFAQLDASMHLDAGGTAGGSMRTSVVLIKWGPLGTQLLLGNNAEIKLSDVRVESVNRGADADGNPKNMTAYVQELLAYPGTKMSRKLASVVRICNITDEAGKGLTPDLLDTAIGMFPPGVEPDGIYMPKVCQKQLHIAKKAASANPENVTRPKEHDDVPIRVTTALALDETAVSFD